MTWSSANDAALRLAQDVIFDDDYLTYRLENVVISAFRPGRSSSSGEDRPTETISLRFARITLREGGTQLFGIYGPAEPVDENLTAMRDRAGR